MFDASETKSLREGKINFHWDFGDGLKAFSDKPFIEHEYESAGEYEAILTARQLVEEIAYTEEEAAYPTITELISTSKGRFGIFPKKENKNPFDKNAASPLGGTVVSTTVGTPSQGTINFGQSVYDTAVVTGNIINGTPTGTVTFFIGSTQIGSPVTLVPGANNTASAVSPTYTPPAVGTFQWTAMYSGDAIYDISQDASPTNSFVVNQASSVTTLATSPNPSVFGQTINLTATVALNTVSNIVPTGQVIFKSNGNSIGTANLVGSGVATLPVSNLPVGSPVLTAEYVGTTEFAGSTSNTIPQTIGKAITSTALSTSGSPSIYGIPVLLTANITVTSGAGTPTGTVTFKDGTTTLGTGTVSGGVATLNVTNFGTGSHNLTAVYVGDTSFETSTSSIFTQVVSKGTTTSAVTSSISPTTYGQSTNFTATVAVNTGSGTPTGSFTFFDGATSLGAVNLSGASATLSVSTLSVGSHSITAVYSGDLNFSTSTSGIFSQVVNKATPAITLTSSLNPSNYSQNITFTSTVTSPTTLGLPTGTVTFLDGGVSIGTGTLEATGANSAMTTFQIVSLSGGTHNITARFEGDSNFVVVTSTPAVPQVVNKLPTTIAIYSASPSPSEFGQPVTLQANVVGSVANPPLSPSGTVTFYDNNVAIGTGTLNMLSPNTGTASFTVTNFSLGNHTLTATYGSDTNYLGSTTLTPMIQTVVRTTTSTTTTTSHTPAVFGETITLTSTVNSNFPGTGSPTGNVQFYDGINLLGMVALTPLGPNSSQATLAVSSLTIGSHQVKSTYTGDTNYSSSTSPNIVQVIVKDPTTTVVTSSSPTSTFGSFVTFSAAVMANAPGSGLATGVVNFYNGPTLIGTGTLNGSGVATYSLNSLYPGTYTISARYVGDGNFVASNSASITQTVITPLNTTTTITSSRDSSPINQAVTYTARVTAITGTPLGTVSFYDNGVLIGTSTLVNGFASILEPGTSLNTLGVHPITAIYSGEPGNFITSTGSYSQDVVPYDTTTVLTIASLAVPPNHVEQANAVLTATVTSNPVHPLDSVNNTVTFYDGTTAISGPILVPASGIVSFSPINLQFGTRNYRAVYSGDNLVFAMSTSNTIVQSVQQTDMLTTSTVLTTSLTPAYLCQSINLTATVTQTQGFYTPTGTVTFFDGTTSLGTAILNSSGVAVLPVSELSVGTHTLTSTYNSDSNYAFSFSNTVTQVIVDNPTTTTISVIPSLISTPYGQELTFVASVQSPFGVPTGSVIFSDELNELATVNVDAQGLAYYVTTTTETGSHVITATYDPTCCGVATPCFGASVASLSHTVTPISPQLALSASPSPAVYGDLVTLYADVSAYLNGEPSGSVTFYKGTTVIGTSPIVQGLATIDVPNLPAGITLFNAKYNGDDNFIPTNFPSRVLLVNKAPINVSLFTASPNPTKFGQIVSLTGLVVSYISTPTGTITFSSNGTPLATVNLDGSGQAGLNTSNLPLGNNTLTATYSGDSNYLAATAPSFVQQVVKSDSITTVISSSPSPSTFNSPVTFSVNVAAANPGAGIPTGSITAFYGSQSLGTTKWKYIFGDHQPK